MREVLSISRTDEIVKELGVSLSRGEDLALLLEHSEGMLTSTSCSFHDLVEVHYFCRAALTHLALEYSGHMHGHCENLVQRLRMKCYDLDDVLEWHMWRSAVIPSALERAREEWEYSSTGAADESLVLFESSPSHWMDLVTPVLAHFKVEGWTRRSRPVLCAPAWFHALLTTRVESPAKDRPYLFSQGSLTGEFSRPLCSETVPAPSSEDVLALMKSDGLQGYSLQELRDIATVMYRPQA